MTIISVILAIYIINLISINILTRVVDGIQHHTIFWIFLFSPVTCWVTITLNLVFFWQDYVCAFLGRFFKYINILARKLGKFLVFGHINRYR